MCPYSPWNALGFQHPRISVRCFTFQGLCHCFVRPFVSGKGGDSHSPIVGTFFDGANISDAHSVSSHRLLPSLLLSAPAAFGQPLPEPFSNSQSHCNSGRERVQLLFALLPSYSTAVLSLFLPSFLAGRASFFVCTVCFVCVRAGQVNRLPKTQLRELSQNAGRISQ